MRLAVAWARIPAGCPTALVWTEHVLLSKRRRRLFEAKAGPRGSVQGSAAGRQTPPRISNLSVGRAKNSAVLRARRRSSVRGPTRGRCRNGKPSPHESPRRINCAAARDQFFQRARHLSSKIESTEQLGYFRRRGYVTDQQDQYLEPIIPLIGEETSSGAPTIRTPTASGPSGLGPTNYAARSRSAGNVNVKTAPRGSPAATHNRPSCASMIERQIDRPIPSPLDFVV